MLVLRKILRKYLMDDPLTDRFDEYFKYSERLFEQITLVPG